MTELPLAATDHDARLLALGMAFCALLLALAFLAELWLGYLGRKKSMEMVERSAARENMLAMKLAGAVSPGTAVPPPLPPALPFPQDAGAGAGAGKPLPEMPIGGELSDDQVWKELNAEWAREALEAKQAEQARVDVITARLEEAKQRRAKALADEGKLGGTPEPTGQSAPSASGP